MPDYLKAATETRRIFLSWFVARDAAEFSPDEVPRLHPDLRRSLHVRRSGVDGVTVKATLDGRGGTNTQAPTQCPGN